MIIGNNAILTAAGTTRAIDVNTQYRTVKNANAGLGWTDMRGTMGQTTIDISNTGQDMSRFRRVEFPAYAGEPEDDAADSGSGSAGSSKLKSVNTGDENDLRAWIVLLAASLTGTAGMAFARKRRGY